MSEEVVAEVETYCSHLRGSARALLKAYARRASAKTREAWLTNAALARDLGLSERRVQELRGLMVERSLLRAVRRHRSGATVYVVDPRSAAQLTLDDAVEEAPQPRVEGCETSRLLHGELPRGLAPRGARPRTPHYVDPIDPEEEERARAGAALGLTGVAGEVAGVLSGRDWLVDPLGVEQAVYRCGQDGVDPVEAARHAIVLSAGQGHWRNAARALSDASNDLRRRQARASSAGAVGAGSGGVADGRTAVTPDQRRRARNLRRLARQPESEPGGVRR